MDVDKDAYGKQVYDYLNGKITYEIIERDDKYIDLSSGSPSYFAEFKDWSEIEQKAIKFAKGKVLDVGTGAGRVSLYLQNKGIDVFAIDNSPLAIKVSKIRGVKSAKVLPIENIDVFEKDTFDTIVMFGNNFGLFGGFNKAKKLLRKFYKITKEDALIIAETNDPYGTKEKVHLDYHKLNIKRGRMSGQLKIRVRYKTYISDWFDYLLVSEKEMREILEDTGWKIKEILKSNNGSGYIAIIGKDC